ncbi:MAG: hypothetical protein H7343_00175 [Undibacterium sp.]|nr:hypothetical protein [Opitutaceae bacterium]
MNPLWLATAASKRRLTKHGQTLSVLPYRHPAARRAPPLSTIPRAVGASPMPATLASMRRHTCGFCSPAEVTPHDSPPTPPKDSR